MIESLITLLIVLLIVGVIWWIGTLVLPNFPAPFPLLTIWNVIMGIVVLIVLLRFLLPIIGVRAPL